MATNCPDDLTLLSFALGAAADPPGVTRVAAHVERCTSCLGTVLRHRELATGVRRATREASDVRGECLDDMAIAALAEGVATDEDRTSATAHLVTCASCRSQLTALRAALGDPAISAAMPSTDARRRRQSLLVGGVSAAGLAAAAVFLFAVGPNRPSSEDAAPMRDETGALVVAPVAVSPVDAVSGTPVFRWSSVPGATRYRVRVFSPDGVVVWETQTSDTIAILPSPTTLPRDARYLWKVEARTDFDRWVGSALTEFRLSTNGVRP